MRRLSSAVALVAVIAAGVLIAALFFWPAQADAQGQVSLMQLLSEWKYPDSKMLGGASMSDGGNPQIQSVKCRAVLTTPDSIEKVIDYYTKKLVASADVILPGTKADAPAADGKSVAVQDDSQGRPFTVRVIVVNKLDTSTTLVISRANDEKETHIAWLHYFRIGEKR